MATHTFCVLWRPIALVEADEVRWVADDMKAAVAAHHSLSACVSESRLVWWVFMLVQSIRVCCSFVQTVICTPKNWNLRALSEYFFLIVFSFFFFNIVNC